MSEFDVTLLDKAELGFPAVSSADTQLFRLATDYKTHPGSAQSGLAYTFRDGLPVLPPETPVRKINLAAKRLLDLVGAGLGIVILAPFLIGVMLVIKTSSKGPALFTQQRRGRNGRLFSIYKFRSMYIHRCDLSGINQTIENDPRVTRIGRFLRRSNIDELPQLINVLRGEMSLVGPRPHAVGMLAGGVTYETLVPYYTLRQAVKPGLTGWAQANGYRGPTHDPAKAIARVDHDIAYIQNFSIMLDIRTIWRTVLSELKSASGF